MDERRKNPRIIARIPCDLLIAATRRHFSGITKNIFAANTAGIEFTVSHPTPEQRAALEAMLETRSNRLD